MTRLFTIPAAVPFLPTLAENLLGGRLIPGFPGADPFALADAVVYLPTQRAARAFASALVAACGRSSLTLPRIVPLGVFAAEEGEFAEFEPGALDERAVVGELERRMTLTRLVAAWGAQLKGAIRRVDAQGRLETDPSEPPLVAATPAQALTLAGDLADLIDDMRIEGVSFAALPGIVADDFDPYWRITLDFLKIAFEAWPGWLAEKGLADRAERTQIAVEREIAGLASRGPTIVAGSTGTNSATAKLIGAVARAGHGAVVLADLDLLLDEPAWRMIADGDDPTATGHPQAALAKLLQRIGVARADVEPLGESGARARFLTEAMRPAESTHLWASAKVEPAPALQGVALIEAEHEAEEALAIAVALRETLETPGRTAALATPDPAIAHRVAVELTRWGVEVENSAGATLGATPHGVLARLALAAAREFTPERIAALAGSELVRLGRTAEEYAAAARALDLGVLRAPLPPGGLEDCAAALAAAREAGASSYAHRGLRSLTPDDLAAAAALLGDFAAALEPLRLADGGPLGGLVAAHAKTLATLAAPDEIGGDVADLLDEWALACGEGFDCDLADYAEMFETLAASRAPPSPRGHPRLAIIGLLEARLLTFDRIVVAGLDETVWPPAARTDAFLNRQMRADLGLSPPERRIGQTAQDFIAALGTADVVISRSKKRDGSPTVASRFLRRIEALAGEETVRLRERGRRYLDIARWLDRPLETPSAPRPAPTPPVELRPDQLSVTQIETLRRDPYAIYAQKILKITLMPPVGAPLNAARLGDIWHKLLEDFGREAPKDARARLLALAEAAFGPLNADPTFRALRWPRMITALEAFLDFDAGRRELAERIWLEARGKLELALADGSTFKLTARADRIELGREGKATLIDYKTGVPPGKAEVEVGFAPQLTLEAAMLKRGAFEPIGKLVTDGAIYFKIGGADGGRAKPISFKSGTFDEIAEQHLTGLKALLERFRKVSTGYVSRPSPKFIAKGTDYDHLARVAEWSLADEEES